MFKTNFCPIFTDVLYSKPDLALSYNTSCCLHEITLSRVAF